MNVAFKVLLFVGEVLLIGGLLSIFIELMDSIAPTFIVYHTAAYAVMALIWSALPALVILGLIIKYTKKEEEYYYGGGY